MSGAPKREMARRTLDRPTISELEGRAKVYVYATRWLARLFA